MTCRRDTCSRWTFTTRSSTRRRSRPTEWFHVGNDNPERRNTIGGFGHYEDELVKVNGQWLFTKRKIYNEGSARWQYKGGVNPAW